MTLKRKLQYNGSLESYFIVVPKQLALALGLQKGDMIIFQLIDNKITLIPEVRRLNENKS